VSPHYYYKYDHSWQIEGTLEVLMHKLGMFDREGALSLVGFEGSGADWLDPYKKYIDGENVIVTSPHKIYGPESNDLALQLRKHGFSKVVLAGMSANLCTESHMRDLIESGFDVSVVKDATAAAIVPGLNGYEAALVNFRMISTHVFTTKEVVKELKNYEKK
jgi:nicotinamidase-related amidase